ncbi:RNA-directed DNA polymerase from mobile element jockey [Araneus ventricosus]|uniref:RNA-directed DNA polymerase from mobile element jockey n=1 Tax=Araneus ventricosus TaxID=182803 RepID=A0A4Y2GTX8_ARAVE|nr:RNA-directed DNA polymerase from mobile element jockey [Araneus ventricosus]
MKHIRMENGEYTKNFRDSIQVVLEHHFPRSEDGIVEKQIKINMNFPVITQEEVKTVMDDMDKNKPPGPDGLTLGIIRELFFLDPAWFTELFNDCTRQGVFPDFWKIAKVLLIPKEGKDLSEVSAYRPICLLPTWGKVYDKIIAQRLLYELESKCKLHRNQFSFRKQRSTLTALDKFHNFIINAKAKKMITLALSLDISDAFNSVIWDDLINCLEEDGISVYLIDVIKDFLSNRRICDDINNTEFNYSKGVPQGSCLGPVLWLLIAPR